VAAIVPVFDRPVSVIEALDSVAAQSRPPDVLVVVDDGSSDETRRRIEVWIAERGGRLPARLVSLEHRGVSAARNRGVEAAGDPDWVAFLDSDDLWPENYLQAHLDALRGRPDAIASSSDKESLDAPSGRTRRVRRDWIAGDAVRGVLRHGPPGVSNTVVRAETLRAIGGFDEALETAEDLDLALRLAVRGPWCHVGGAPVVYRHRLGEVRGEAPSLGHQHPDRRRTRARVLERFLAVAPRERPDLVPEIERLVGRQWAKAGRQLERLGRTREAADCLRRALSYRPLDLRARLRLGWLGCVASWR
jgi:glycosyltransferase involved in cell wall biosynthesis